MIKEHNLKMKTSSENSNVSINTTKVLNFFENEKNRVIDMPYLNIWNRKFKCSDFKYFKGCL